MNSLLQADIFFFITTVIVLIFAVIGLIAAYYIVHILRSVRYIADKVKIESDHVTDDIHELRGRLKEGGAKFSTIIRTLASFFFAKATSKRKRKTDQE